MPDKPTRFAARRPPLALCGGALASCAVRTVQCSVGTRYAPPGTAHRNQIAGARRRVRARYQMIDADWHELKDPLRFG
eukprot:6194795-Pleurochrysis_carterae.AAC.5